MKWVTETIHLQLKSQWSIHGGSINDKKNHIIKLNKNGFIGVGEISASTKNNDKEIIDNDLQKIDFTKLTSLIAIENLKICPQVKHGIILAWINTELKEKKRKIHEFFNITQTDSAPTNYSIPILPLKDIGPYINNNFVNEYSSCKVKINGQQSKKILDEVSKHYKGPLRIDANEGFQSAQECLKLINSCHNLNIEFLEQPLHRTQINDSKLLKKESPWLIIGDESLQNENINELHAECFHGLNIKLMKSGGPLQAVEQIKQCKIFDLKILIGCMVESSLNISTALQLSHGADWWDLDGSLLLKNDPFNLVKIVDGNIQLC